MGKTCSRTYTNRIVLTNFAINKAVTVTEVARGGTGDEGEQVAAARLNSGTMTNSEMSGTSSVAMMVEAARSVDDRSLIVETTGVWVTASNSVENRVGGMIPGSQNNRGVIPGGVATVTDAGSIYGRQIGACTVGNAFVFSPKRAAWLRKNVPHFRECEAMMTRVQKEAQASRNAFAITANDRIGTQLAS